MSTAQRTVAVLTAVIALAAAAGTVLLLLNAPSKQHIERVTSPSGAFEASVDVVSAGSVAAYVRTEISVVRASSTRASTVVAALDGDEYAANIKLNWVSPHLLDVMVPRSATIIKKRNEVDGVTIRFEQF